MQPLESLRLEAWESFLRTYSTVIGEIEKALDQAAAVPLTWYDVLLVLEYSPGRQRRLQELAKKIVISKSGLTRALDRMEHAQLVTRKRSDQDRRGYYCKMTAKGRRALKSAWPVYRNAIFEQFGRHLSAKDARILRSLLDRMRS